MSKNNVNNHKKLNNFFDKQEKRVAARQKEISEDVIDTLFDLSPHVDTAPFSYGEYDANHKISVNGSAETPWRFPTLSRAVSKSFINEEKANLEGLKCGDTVTIRNESYHAEDVEFGFLRNNDWNRPGYMTYTLTKAFAKGKWGNVIK